MVHKKITIQRYAFPDLRRERHVYVIFPSGKTRVVNPQLEILKATGIRLPRYSCVLSMADGMTAAGSKVTFGVYSPKPDMPRHPSVRDYKYDRTKHVLRENPVPAYFFLGFALAHERWDELQTELRSFFP